VHANGGLAVYTSTDWGRVHGDRLVLMGLRSVGALMVEGLADVDPSERPGGLVAGLGEREHLLREVVSLLVEIPCFTSRRARIEKKISIWLGHEAWAGVS
jgi:hypothetical protein